MAMTGSTRRQAPLWSPRSGDVVGIEIERLGVVRNTLSAIPVGAKRIGDDDGIGGP
jgi:hypothetical protein